MWEIGKARYSGLLVELDPSPSPVSLGIKVELALGGLSSFDVGVGKAPDYWVGRSSWCQRSCGIVRSGSFVQYVG